MNVQEQIKKYITSQPEPKRSDLRELHRLALQVSPESKLWFFDGKDSKNHTVSNPTIGYGFHTIKHSNGKSREFFRIGVSAPIRWGWKCCCSTSRFSRRLKLTRRQLRRIGFLGHIADHR